MIEIKSIIEKFYVDAISLVQNDLEKKNLETLLFELKKVLEKSYEKGFLEVINGKIKLNYNNLIKMSEKEIFKKHSFETHKLIKKIKKKRIIDSKSLIYPKNIKFFSANPLSKVFLKSNLNEVEKILKIKDELFNDIKSFNNHIELYIYMRLFSLNRIKSHYILKIDRNSFFNLTEELSILVISFDEKDIQNYNHIETFLIDKDLSTIFKNAYNKQTENLLNSLDHIFTDDLKSYETQKDKFLQKHNLTLSDCKRAVDFEYLINNSPLELTLKNFNIYPKITLKELDYLFPRKIPNSLIKLEQNNFDLFFNDIKTSNPEILSADDEDIDDYLLKPFEILDELKKIKIDGKVEIFFNKKYRLIDKHLKKDDFFSEILMYIKKELFKKADKRFTNNPIKINTMREYMNTLFKYCFNILLKYNEINNFAKIEINQKLEREKLTENSRNKYKEIINRFLSKYSKSILKINSVIDIRRSIVFPDEFNKFINIVLEQDKKVFANENYKFIKGLIRSVFAILLYNSGLRKNELRTRLQKDIIKIGDNEYIIYVDKQGFKEAKRSGKSDSDDSSLKNKNAKRKIRFKIENKEHNEIVAKYYNWITKNNYKFFFPLIAQEKPLEKQTDKEKSLEKHIAQKRLLKRHIAKESFFNELSEILKQITNRHTPLHSLRHSFITFWLLDKLKNKDYEKITMFELANIIGHAEIETTLKNYVHLDIIKVLLNRNI